MFVEALSAPQRSCSAFDFGQVGGQTDGSQIVEPLARTPKKRAIIHGRPSHVRIHPRARQELPLSGVRAETVRSGASGFSST